MIDNRKATKGLAAVAAVAVAAAMAGCGGGASSDQKTTTSAAPVPKAENAAVAQVLADLQSASRAGQGRRICTQIFTPKLANSVTAAAASGSCAKEVKKKLFSRKAQIVVQNLTVPNAANATATVKEANGNVSTVFLVKQSGLWRIRSIQAA
jgi:hypothetical protein